jgi:hypothetical protein
MLLVALPAFVLLAFAALAGLVLPRRHPGGELVRATIAMTGPALVAIALAVRLTWRFGGQRAGVSHGTILGGLCADLPLTPVPDQGAAWVAALGVWSAAAALVTMLRAPPRPALLRRLRSGRARWVVPVGTLLAGLLSLAWTGRLEGPGCGFPALAALTELPQAVGHLASPARRSARAALPAP